MRFSNRVSKFSLIFLVLAISIAALARAQEVGKVNYLVPFLWKITYYYFLSFLVL